MTPARIGVERDPFRRLSVNSWEYIPAKLPQLRLTARRVEVHSSGIRTWVEGYWVTQHGGQLFHDWIPNVGAPNWPTTSANNARRYEGLQPDQLVWHIREFKTRLIDACFTAGHLTMLAEADEGAVPPDLVEDLLPSDVDVWYYGGRGSAKTLLMLLLATCAYYGLPFLGWPTTKAVTLFCEWEEQWPSMRRNLERIALGLDVPIPNLPHLWCAGRPLRHQVDQIAEVCANTAARVLVVDPVLAAAGASSEHGSNADGITYLIEAVRSLGSVTGVYLDHPNQDDLKRGGDFDPRDSGRKLDVARVGYQVTKLAHADGEMRLKIRQAKPRPDRPPIEPFGVSIRWFHDGAITFARSDDLSADITVATERDGTHRDLIIRALQTTGRATRAELAALCNLPAPIVSARLGDKTGKRLFIADGDYYRLREAS